jgi:ABC-2 type transport system ATP-binding protein
MKDGNIISVKNLTKKFGNFTAVDDISFDVKKGEIFAFLGPNGAGKSTTIKVLTTLLDPTDGKVRVNDLDLHEKDAVRHSFGIVFQDPSLDDDLTAMENLQLHSMLYGIPKEVREKRIKELLGFVELWERRTDLVKNFSGGMKRRLEIARGLLHHPKILFLDEPTLGLDPQTRNHTWNYIKNINKNENMTVFFTTHYMDEAEKIADRIAVVDRGKIVAQGTSRYLEKLTKTTNLEDAFLNLTGHEIREETVNPLDRMRQRRMAHHR